MSDFESIDDYLGNRLSEPERDAFEKRAASDPSLKADVDMQRQIIAGVQNARRLELKALLAAIPVGSLSGSGSSTLAGKIAAGFVAAGVIGTTVYFTVLHKTAPAEKTKTEITAKKPAEDAAGKTEIPAVTAAPQDDQKKPEASTVKQLPSPVKAQTAAPAEDKKQTVAAAAKPTLEVVDPSEDMTTAADDAKPSSNAAKGGVTVSRIAVDTDASNKKYNFHYQFAGDKLMLFGPFDKTLYDILEINGDKKSVFLLYKGSYYKLNDQQHAIAPLVPISDQTLIRKLKEYQGK